MQRIEVGLLTLMVFLVGCPSGEEDSWTQIELISDVVWSDDQQAIAYTLERYEQKIEGTAPYLNVQTRNHRYSVWIANPDGSEAQERLSLQPTRPLGELRYFRSSDTLFIHDSRENRRVAWVHTSDGGSVKLAESNEEACDGLVFTTLPSPDGRRVAIVRGDEDPACLEIATTNATVSIVNTDGESLEMGPLTLGFVNRSPEMSWTPSGNFVLSDFETTYRIAGQEWDLSPLPGCFEPATTSGRRGVDGRTIWYEDGAFVTEPSDQVWGCQCEADGAALYCRQVNYLDELEGDSKVRYCQDFIALAGGSGERACPDGSYFVVQELEECVAAELPHCSIDDFEKCVEAGINDPCELFSDPPYACLDFAQCF